MVLQRVPVTRTDVIQHYSPCPFFPIRFIVVRTRDLNPQSTHGGKHRPFFCSFNVLLCDFAIFSRHLEQMVLPQHKVWGLFDSLHTHPEAGSFLLCEISFSPLGSLPTDESGQTFPRGPVMLPLKFAPLF